MNAAILPAAALALCLLGTGAQAEIIDFTASLDGASEVPARTLHAHGSAKAELDTDTDGLTFVIDVRGLTGPAVAAHFLGPADVGQNAPPVVMIAPSASPLQGYARLTPAQVSDLRAGRWYVNVHTALNPGGEIRGQMLEERPLPTARSSGPAAAPAMAQDGMETPPAAIPSGR